jgi:hypothetical protein
MAIDRARAARGALAGAVAAGVWAAQQPLDKRVFGSDHDDVELLGKLVTRGSGWHTAGLAIHVANGVLFGIGYSLARPFIPAPPVAAGVLTAMAENFGTWPLTAVVDRHHPAKGDLEPLSGNGRALAQSTWRHFVFGVVLGELERRLNSQDEFEPPTEVPVASNGHGNIERAAAAAG